MKSQITWPKKGGGKTQLDNDITDDDDDDDDDNDDDTTIKAMTSTHEKTDDRVLQFLPARDVKDRTTFLPNVVC